MSTTPSFELIMRPGVAPEEAVHKPPLPPLGYASWEVDGLRIERNVSVPMRDGVRIYVDIYRPAGAAGEQGLATLLGWSPYGKHGLSDRLWPPAGVQPGWISRFTAFEAPDPAYWCPLGYAVVFPDPRGAWQSEGELRHNGRGEGEDCYDLIEWLAVCPWSNGKIGMTGVSYLAAIQYLVAALQPPHLAALNPWEGFSDWYREFGYHGGIRETGFAPRGSANLRFSRTRTEDTEANMRAHPLYDAYWQSKDVALQDITTPAFVVASWSDQGLHTRGTLEAFKHMSSRQKWLEVHGRKKWAHYYQPSSREKQRQFFDHFLKGTDDRVLSWPPVQIEVRQSAAHYTIRNENEWPLARTRYTPLYLDATTGTLAGSQPATAAVVSYNSESPAERAHFDYTFREPAELTGHMKLRLWVRTEEADDMDLFVALQKLDRSGQEVGFVFYAFYENGPVALGWLRASHRELDVQRSSSYQPVHRHVREIPLERGVPTPLDIEIWPSSTQFEAGESLRVVVQGHDIYTEALPNLPFARHQELRNRGRHILHTGGAFDAHLLVPLIPRKVTSP